MVLFGEVNFFSLELLEWIDSVELPLDEEELEEATEWAPEGGAKTSDLVPDE